MKQAEPASSDSCHVVGVEVTLFTIEDRGLQVVLWGSALPSATVGSGESLDAAAHRVLLEHVRIDAPVRQIQAFDRDLDQPSDRVIGVAYAALLPLDALQSVANEHLALVGLRDGIPRGDDGAAPSLPHGQDEVIALALADLRAHLDSTSWAYGLLPDEFTLRQLQHVHEAIAGREFHRMAFRKRLLDSDWLEPTGRREAAATYRPAELYRLKPEHARDR